MRAILCILVANLLMTPVAIGGTNLRWTPMDGPFPSKALGLTNTSYGHSIRAQLGVSDECDLVEDAVYMAAKSTTERYSLTCRDYKIWGSEIIVRKDLKGYMLSANATLPSIRDVYNIHILGEYLKSPPLQLAHVDKEQLEAGFLMQEGELVPVFKRTSIRGATRVPFIQFVSAILGTPIRTIPNAIGSDALVFEHNHTEPNRVWRQIDNINTKLDHARFRVLPDIGARTFAQGGEFEDSERSSGHKQAQVFYAIQKINDYWQSMGVTSQGQIDVMIDSAYGGHTNNALYLPKTNTLPAEIHIGPGGGDDHAYSLDNDIAQHEFTHHILDPHLGNSHLESLLLHEALADFFTANLNDDPEFAPSIRKDGRPLRSMLLSGGNAIDDRHIDWGIHELSQFLSSTLWEMRRYIENMDQLVWQAVTMTGRNTPLQDFFWALEQADRTQNGALIFRQDTESEVLEEDFSAFSCEIYGPAIEFGFARFLPQHDSTPCGLPIADITEESKDRKPALFAHLDGLYESSLSAAEGEGGCGVIGSNHGSDGSKIPTLLLLLPFLALIRPRVLKLFVSHSV